MLNEAHPIVRRLIRFALLPYCYLNLVNWKECTRNRIQVLYDFLYIFFKLKTFPDHYGSCRLWEIDKSKWKYYYGSIYHPYQRQRLRKEVQKKEYQIVLVDKVVGAKFCECIGINQPKMLGNIAHYENFSDRIKQLFTISKSNVVIIKPILGSAGMGIVLANKKEDDTVVVQTKHEFVNSKEFVLKESSIVQEYICQCAEIASFAHSSVNTIRVVTLLTKSNDVLITSARIRFGDGKSYVDNVCAGGIAVGINCQDGTLFETGFDKKGCRYIKHPLTGVVFKGFQIPVWDKVVKMAIKVQQSFSFYKLIGMDIAIGADYEPVLIEVNASPDIVGEERTTGPYLIKPEVLKAFSEYDLLVAKDQQQLINKF